MDDLWFGSDIVPISTDMLRAELAERCREGEDKNAKPVNPNKFWPIKFLRDYWKSGGKDESALELAIRCTHRPTELQHFLFRVYSRHFVEKNAEATQEFLEFCRGAQLVSLHVSCQPRVHLASASVESFSAHRKGIRHVIVIGCHMEATRQSYVFDSARGILEVPAPDTYEGLPRKMAALFRFLGFSGSRKCVMKLDDDVRCHSKFSIRSIVNRAETYDYAGRLMRPRFGLNRCWHFGKCHNSHLNMSPYSMIAESDYAQGHAYFLSTRAINILSKASVYLCQNFDVEYYEDVAVGKILNFFGIEPYNYDPFKAGALSSELFPASSRSVESDSNK